jgi:hypothetical protein
MTKNTVNWSETTCLFLLSRGYLYVLLVFNCDKGMLIPVAHSSSGLSTVNHKMVESDKFCRSLPKMGQVLEFAKIRV